MKKFLVILCLLIGNLDNAFSQENKENKTEIQLKVINTFIELGYYNPKECLDIITAIENRSKECEQIGANFVKHVYANNSLILDTTDCKIIWKAILVSVRTNQDGFELMDVPTPWITK